MPSRNGGERRDNLHCIMYSHTTAKNTKKANITI
jgi:hypothetical protein